MKCIQIMISGKVQGVFFRENIQKRAWASGIVGWTRNVDADKVEIVAQGEEEDLEKLILYCQKGPTLAKVNDVTVEEKEIEKELKIFEVR